jgi:ribosomal protein S10
MATFMIALRGYDTAEVDRLLAKGEQAAASHDAALRLAVKSELGSAQLRIRLRGYDRHQVDRAINELASRLE